MCKGKDACLCNHFGVYRAAAVLVYSCHIDVGLGCQFQKESYRVCSMARTIAIRVVATHKAFTPFYSILGDSIFWMIFVKLTEIRMCQVDPGVKNGSLYSSSRGLSTLGYKSLSPRVEFSEPDIDALDAGL